MLKSRPIFGLTAILVAHSHVALAEDPHTEQPSPVVVDAEAESLSADSIVIDGDKLELRLDRKMRAIGNASITRKNQHIFADKLEYDTQNDEVFAEGHVRIELDNTKLTGPELRLKLSENIGQMQNASIVINKSIQTPAKNKSAEAEDSIQDGYISSASFAKNTSNPLELKSNQTDGAVLATRGDAKTIFFEGENKKRLADARFTTCAANSDDWYIKAHEVNLDDYTESATAKHASIEFKGVPILYSPWMSFSFNNQRKSGFLAPIMSFTNRLGFSALAPYYINIAPNIDATIGTRLSSKRGIQLQGELRYLDEHYSGINNLEYVPSDNVTGETRYFGKLNHEHIFGNGWSAGYNLEKVSDEKYFSEFSTMITATSRVNLPQQLNLDYEDETWKFNTLVQKFQTLRKDSFPYERLPQLSLTGNKYYGNINTNLQTQFVAFDLNSNVPDGQKNDPTGTRFVAYPNMSISLARPYGFIKPKFGIHHTSYNLNNVSDNLQSQQRTLPIFSVDSGLYFDRNFKISNRGYSQTLEPRLFYVYIPERKQDNLPIFDTTLSDLNFSSMFNENQYVGNDRINDANQLSFALTSRFIENSSGAQRLSASIGQRYYFSDQKVTTPGVPRRENNSSDIIAGISGQLKNSWIIDAFWQYNTDNSNSVRSSISTRYNPEPGKVLNLGYSYRQDSIDQIDASSQWSFGSNWYGIGRINYSFKENRIIETIGGLEYNAGCWQARAVMQRITTATANERYAFFFQLELGGLASIGANPMKIIERNIPGYTSPGTLSGINQQSYYE